MIVALVSSSALSPLTNDRFGSAGWVCRSVSGARQVLVQSHETRFSLGTKLSPIDTILIRFSWGLMWVVCRSLGSCFENILSKQSLRVAGLGAT